MRVAHFTYVIVGSGAAGSAAALAARRHDAHNAILLLGQEASRPYLRTQLSKSFLRRQQTRAELNLDPVGYYAERKIELRTGRRAVDLDTPRRQLTLDNAEQISFEKLLLAPGMLPKSLSIAGIGLPNTFYLRTLDDADRILHAIDQARSTTAPGVPACAAVIGNNLLACEVAASLRQCGLAVTLLLDGAPHPWSKRAGPVTGGWIADLLTRNGVTLVKTPVERLAGDGRVQRIALSDGTAVSCHFVIAAVGSVVNRALLRGTPIDAAKAILVDARLRTTVDGIFAAGDCAAVFDARFGKHRRLEHWPDARASGEVAGANMAGANLVFDRVATFDSELFGVPLRGFGEWRHVNHRVIRGQSTLDSTGFAEIGLAGDGRAAQVIAVGPTQESVAFERLVHERSNLIGREEAIKDPGQPL